MSPLELLKLALSKVRRTPLGGIDAAQLSKADLTSFAQAASADPRIAFRGTPLDVDQSTLRVENKYREPGLFATRDLHRALRYADGSAFGDVAPSPTLHILGLEHPFDQYPKINLQSRGWGDGERAPEDVVRTLQYYLRRDPYDLVSLADNVKDDLRLDRRPPLSILQNIVNSRGFRASGVPEFVGKQGYRLHNAEDQVLFDEAGPHTAEFTRYRLGGRVK